MRSRAAASAVALLLILATGQSGEAHESDPAVVTVLDDITPPLPDGVRVQVVSGIAAQLLVENTTAVPLEAVADTGEVFLRVSASGVEANLGSTAWYDSNLPSGRARVPSSAIGPTRFARVQTQPSWGWFDHRLHPSDVVVSPEVRAAKGRSRLAEWAVPLRYGGTEVTARGHLEYRPVLGRVVAEVTSARLPEGVELTTVDGRLPAVFLRNGTARPVRVLGADGELFALVGPDQVLVNPRSRVHIEDSRSRGVQPTLAPAGAGLVVVSSSPNYSWLDLRLRYSEPEVPGEVQRSRRPTVLARWTVPVEVAGVRTKVTGTTSFVPFAAAAAGPRGGAARVRWLLLGCLIVLGAVVLIRRRHQPSRAGLAAE